jgi:branched-chain amino acid transport system ATP-binding protein
MTLAKDAVCTAAHLSVEGLSAGYGDVPVLHDISFDVPRGRIVAIVGANGAGKTTLLSAIAGLVRPSRGRVAFDGIDIAGTATHSLPGRGLTLVPEGGRLFTFMTVRENLELGAFAPAARAETARRLEEVVSIFPILGERRDQLAGRLSGGERQMCAIGRALMSGPSLLMLDEPSVGLSPLMAERVLETVAGLVRKNGLTVVIVEQRVTEVLTIADEGHVLDHGRLVHSGTAEALRNDRNVQHTYMGL